MSLPAFDEEFYLQQNPDVAAAVSSGIFASGSQHYELFGAGEGRDPSPLFDTSYYLEINRDVAENGINPLLHFVLFGELEGRRPGDFASFSGQQYLQNNPDVAAAVQIGQFAGAFDHFVKYGFDEGRQFGTVFMNAGNPFSIQATDIQLVDTLVLQGNQNAPLVFNLNEADQALSLDGVQSGFDQIILTQIENAAQFENTIQGNGLSNFFIGSSGRDFIFGGAGPDIIGPEEGKDQLSGGTEADIFIFNQFTTVFGAAGADEIIDFNPSEGDKIEISDTAVSGFVGENQAPPVNAVSWWRLDESTTMVRFNDNGEVRDIVLQGFAGPVAESDIIL